MEYLMNTTTHNINPDILLVWDSYSGQTHGDK